MLKKKFYAVIIISFTFGMYLILGYSAPIQAKDKVTLQYAGNMPMEHKLTKTMYKFKDLVEEYSGGEVIIKVYPAGQLYTDKEYPEAIRSGAVDMVQSTPSFWEGVASLMCIPYLVGIWEGGIEQTRNFSTGPGKDLMNKQLQEAGAIWLGYNDYHAGFPRQALCTKKSINTIAEFKGKKVRAWGTAAANMFREFEATPVVMSSSEYYMGLQRGVIDAILTGVSSVVLRSLYEISEYVYLWEDKYQGQLFSGSNIFGVIANQDKWKKLTDQQQKWILKANEDANDWAWKEYKAKGEGYVQKIKKEVPNVVYFSEEMTHKMIEAAKKASWEYLEKTTGKKMAKKAKQALSASMP